MKTEIEAKFLDVDVGLIQTKLNGAGAKLAYNEREMKRKVFDFPDSRLEKIGGWVRVRDEGGGTVTLSYKRLIDRSFQGTKEITVEVNNFEETCNLLQAIGMNARAYQETKREKWMLGGVEVTIDTWPWIPTLVELDGPSEEAVKMVADKLGFDWNEAMHGSVETAYQKYYDVTEVEVDGWDTITFIPVPEWLEMKRKLPGPPYSL
jgi:adenylate cyclase class 2